MSGAFKLKVLDLTKLGRSLAGFNDNMRDVKTG